MERAIEIIVHTIRLIFNNLKQALHISITGFLAVMVLFLVLFSVGAVGHRGSEQFAAPMVFGLLLIAMPIIVFLISAIAVAWHRYILLDEEPRGIFPLKLDANAWRYTLRAIKLTLLFIAVAIIPLMLFSLIMGPVMTNAFSSGVSISAYIAVSFPNLILQIFLMYIFSRLLICLPAVALGRNEYTVSDAWRDSASENSTIFWIVVITGCVSWLVSLAMILPFISSSPPFITKPPLLFSALSMVWNWFAFMFSICILTSLYGIIVEKRSL